MGDWSNLWLGEHGAAWANPFADLSAKIAAALQPIAPRIEHVGSTAVQGLAAKPVVDLDVVLASSVDLPKAIGFLAALGYVHQGDLGVKGREAFHSPHNIPATETHIQKVNRPSSEPRSGQSALRIKVLELLLVSVPLRLNAMGRLG